MSTGGANGGIYIGAPGTIGAAIARDDRLKLEDQAARQAQAGDIALRSLIGGMQAPGTAATKQMTMQGPAGDYYPAFAGGNRTVGQNREATAGGMNPGTQLGLLSKFAPGVVQSALAQQAISQLGLSQPNYVSVDNIGLVQTNAAGGPKTVIQAGQPQRAPNFVTLGNGRDTKSFDVSDPAQLATARQLAGTGWTEVKTPPASVNVNLPDAKGDVKYMEEMGKLMAEDFAKIQAGGSTSQQSLQKFDRLGGLLDGINTGAFKGTTTQLKSIAKSAGVDLDSLGVRDDVAPAQAAKAIANEIALQLRNPFGGAGMPGAMSDSDREFLMQMVPGLETTPEGNKLLVDYWRRVNQRGIDVARKAREYVKKNGGKFDYGFYDELNDYAEKNPLFAKEQASVATAVTRPRATNPLTGEAVEWNGTEWEMVK